MYYWCRLLDNPSVPKRIVALHLAHKAHEYVITAFISPPTPWHHHLSMPLSSRRAAAFFYLPTTQYMMVNVLDQCGRKCKHAYRVNLHGGLLLV